VRETSPDAPSDIKGFLSDLLEHSDDRLREYARDADALIEQTPIVPDGGP
jgi:hypothetical protein